MNLKDEKVNVFYPVSKRFKGERRGRHACCSRKSNIAPFDTTQVYKGNACFKTPPLLSESECLSRDPMDSCLRMKLLSSVVWESFALAL